MNAPLKPVSFRKNRKYEPRLSPKAAPGRHSDRFWSDDEIAVLRRYYGKGVAACLARLPGRTRQSIQGKAFGLGIDGPQGGGTRERIKVPANIDDLIREAWPLLDVKRRGAVAALAHKLEVPRHWLTVRATKLQLVTPFHKEPPWSAAELGLLKKVPLHDGDKAVEFFRSHGYKRSATSIWIKAARAGVSRRFTETLSATAASKILGVDSKAVTSCCIDGTLRATRRKTKRLNQQGGDVWSIERADLRQYVIDNLYRVDFRKVDKFALVDLLTRTHKARAPWCGDEDTIVRDGYRRKLPLQQIAQAMQDAGFAKRAPSSIFARAKELGCRAATRSDVWTKEEDAILRREYAAKTRLVDIVGKLSEAGFTRHRGAVQMRAIAIGITLDRVNYWTETEKEIALAGLQAGKTHGQVREDLKAAGFIRGPTSMSKFAQKHHVIRKRDSWTDVQVATLRQRYAEKVPPKQIASELGKTIGAVRTLASNLGLKQRIPWSDDEYRILRDAHAAGDALTVAADRIGRPYPNVARVAVSIGLSFKKTRAVSA